MHEPLPECIDRLARIETSVSFIKTNHLVHIENELKTVQEDMKTTQKFIIAQVIGVGIAMLGILGKVLFF